MSLAFIEIKAEYCHICHRSTYLCRIIFIYVGQAEKSVNKFLVVVNKPFSLLIYVKRDIFQEVISVSSLFSHINLPATYD